MYYPNEFRLIPLFWSTTVSTGLFLKNHSQIKSGSKYWRETSNK